MVGPLVPPPPGVGQLLQSLVTPGASRALAERRDGDPSGGFADRLGDPLDLSPDARRALDGLGDLDRLLPGGRQVVDAILGTLDRLTRDLFGAGVPGGPGGGERARGGFLDQLKNAVGGSPSLVAAGAQYLGFEGFELKISRSDGGIDISFDRVSIQAASAFGVAAGDAGVAAYAGFAAQISTLSVDIHIDTGHIDTRGGALPWRAPLAQPLAPTNGPPPPLLLDLLGPGDPRRNDAAGRPRQDDGFFQDVGEVLRNLREVVDRLRALAADLREQGDAAADEDAADGPATTSAPTDDQRPTASSPDRPLPSLVLIRETEFEASRLTRLRFDLYQPLPRPLDASREAAREAPGSGTSSIGGVTLTA